MNTVMKIYRWCTRYISFTLLIVLAYLAFMLFFNDNSVMRAFALKHEIDSLQTEIDKHRDSMAKYQELNRMLDTDAETVERVDRERYHMQRADEDVFIVE